MAITRRDCRACGGQLEAVLSLGTLRLNAFPLPGADLDALPRAPLTLTVCRWCGLAQLDRTVDPDLLYRDYWYRSGVNEMMVRELREVVREAIGVLGELTPKDLVIDIGANDGTLLDQYRWVLPSQVPYRIAVEPALNLLPTLRAQLAQAEVWTQVHSGYFPTPALAEHHGRAAIVTAVAMCYDLEDPNAFFRELAALLRPDGVAVVQFQDMGQMLECAAFDNICHEHLEYYTLHSLYPILSRAGLMVQEVTRTPINGGSLRVILRRPGVATQGVSVAAQLAVERAQGLDTITLVDDADARAYEVFGRRVSKVQQHIRAVMEGAAQSSATIDVYGASTKGNILLQALNLGPGQIRQAIDRSPQKHGHCTVTGIPIVGEAQARELPAQLWLVPIWQFRPSVLKREKWYLDQGGRLIFPLPQVEIVSDTWTLPVGS